MKLKFLLIILLTFNLIYAQKPILKGKINLSVSNKTFQADLKLVSIPENLKSFQLILNKKFHRVKFYDGNDLKPDTITFDPAVSDEGYLYHFKNYQSNTLGVRFSYKERNSNDSSDDWMGNIAFKDNKLRISEQSAWFPTLYDSINDIYYNDIPYDLEIECPDCKSIYINGQDPRKTTKTFVTSNNKPYELMLFAGDFDFERLDDNYIINSNLTKKDKKVIGKTIDSIKRYYGSKTNIEYNSAVNLIHTTAKDEKSEFLFVSYPTITQVGNLELNYFFNSKIIKSFYSMSLRIIILGKYLAQIHPLEFLLMRHSLNIWQ